MMTLEEAIIHCEDVANDRAGCCEDCAEEHRQLAEWLKELKAYKEQTGGDLISRQAVMRIVAFECGEWKGLAKTIIKEIEQLSPITPKEEPERVMCATCKHYNEHPTGMLAVERWCRSPIWERAGRAPHPINHDGFKLIICDYYERMEGQNNGKV